MSDRLIEPLYFRQLSVLLRPLLFAAVLRVLLP
jgi:hypothetical protein